MAKSIFAKAFARLNVTPEQQNYIYIFINKIGVWVYVYIAYIVFTQTLKAKKTKTWFLCLLNNDTIQSTGYLVETKRGIFPRSEGTQIFKMGILDIIL